MNDLWPVLDLLLDEAYIEWPDPIVAERAAVLAFAGAYGGKV